MSPPLLSILFYILTLISNSLEIKVSMDLSSYEVETDSRSLSRSNKASSIKIGGIFPLRTPSEKINDIGFMRAQAFRCALRNASAQFEGRNVFYRVMTSNDELKRTFMAATDAIGQKSIAIIGPSSSSTTEFAAKYFSNLRIPVISYAATSEALSDPQAYSNFLRALPVDRYQLQAMIKFASSMGWTSLSGIFTDDLYGKSVYEKFSKTAESHKVAINCALTISSKEEDWKKTLQENFIPCIGRNNVNVLVIFARYDLSIAVFSYLMGIKEMRSRIFFASDAWAQVFSPYYTLNLMGNRTLKDFSNVIGFIPKMGENMDSFYDCVKSMKATEERGIAVFWESRFRCLVDNSRNNLPPCPNNNIKSRKADGPPECACTGSEALDWRPEAKLSYVYDATKMVIEAIRKLIYECGAACKENIRPGDILAQLKSMKYEGVTGTIQFEGTERKESFYDVLQYGPDATERVVARFIGSNQKLYKVGQGVSMSQLEFFKGSSFEPKTVSFNDQISIIINTMAFTGILVSLSFMYYFHANRKSRVIKKSSPMFIQLMLLGIVIMFLSVVIWSITPGSVSCSLQIILPVVGFNFVMSNLLAKSYRIWKIFNNVRMSTLVITDMDLLKFSSLTLFFNSGLLAGYLVPQLPTGINSFYSGPDGHLVDLTCGNESSIVQNIFLALLFIFNGSMILFGCAVAYLTRKVDSAYNESKYITFVMYTILLLSALVMPVYAIINSTNSVERYENLYIIRSVALLLMSSITMLALFVPKIISCQKLKQQ